MIIIIITLKSAIQDFLQSPQCAANFLQHVRSSGQGTSCANHVQHIGTHITYNTLGRLSRATHWDAYHIQHIGTLITCNTLGRLSHTTHWDAYHIQHIETLITCNTLRRLSHATHWDAYHIQHIETLITCNTLGRLSHTTHWDAYHMNVVCHMVRRDSSAIEFGRVEIAFISALFYWLNH